MPAQRIQTQRLDIVPELQQLSLDGSIEQRFLLR